jgi:hypothetical protein
MLVNPGSREGGTLGRLQAILAGLPDLAVRSRILPLNSLPEATAELANLPEEEIPVAVGGDGTVQMLACALRMASLKQKPLALLPMGTGNAFAHGLGLGNLDIALSALAKPQLSQIDVFVTTHPQAPVVLSSLSIGIESRTISGLAERQGWSRYAQGFSRGMASIASHWRGTSIILDGDTFLDSSAKSYNVGIYNQPCYAFGKVVHRQANPRDGWGWAALHERADSYWQFMLTGAGEQNASGSRGRTWRRAEFETEHPIQADGEALSGGQFTVTVDPHSLTVVMPPNSAERSE